LQGVLEHLHCHVAGVLAGLMPAKTVGHHEETELLFGPTGVFVVRPHGAD